MPNTQYQWWAQEAQIRQHRYRRYFQELFWDPLPPEIPTVIARYPDIVRKSHKFQHNAFIGDLTNTAFSPPVPDSGWIPPIGQPRRRYRSLHPAIMASGGLLQTQLQQEQTQPQGQYLIKIKSRSLKTDL